MRRYKIVKGVFLSFVLVLAIYPQAYGEEDTASLIKIKREELIKKENELKAQEERLKELQADIDKKVEKYQGILSQIEGLVSGFKEMNAVRMKSVVKDYEAMGAEDAAQKLSGLDEQLAANILLKMNPRKAGKALARMGTKKAVSITEKMSDMTKNFPVN
ncbi:MAG: hypothetical protein L3V56_11575 [Candidatus Magnetoovum sp. WYHC-5]|nr:hypothetical protein [Candidatus Magnetoovum sp. WYHC-5]